MSVAPLLISENVFSTTIVRRRNIWIYIWIISYNLQIVRRPLILNLVGRLGLKWLSSSLCHAETSGSFFCLPWQQMKHLFLEGLVSQLSLDCLGDLYYDRGASLCVKSKRLSKQMQMLPIVFQTTDTASHAERGTRCGVDGKQTAIIKADAFCLGKLGFTSISSAFSITNFNRTLLCCRFISLDIRVSSVT